ncbi:mitochondrial ribosomal protein [Xylariaceae sp. FL0804]|nr:mitochondrial ribosomal protein [Xylariaceae sp. FL0804]
MGTLKKVKPGRVFQTATDLLNHRVLPGIKVNEPPWYKIIEITPPGQIAVRPLPPQHRTPNPRVRKPSRMFQPQQLVYEEDALRRTFYKDHPWELARPRMIIEMDGKDAQRFDWSKGLRQPAMPLCGESVVQRQLWMMHNVPGITTEQAYDKVRREFYRLRQEEEVERRIAKEEAQMVGAYFGKGALQFGMELEDKTYEQWKRWAAKQIETSRANADAAYTSFGAAPDSEAEAETVEDSIAEAILP